MSVNNVSKLTFEQSMKRLEEIIDNLESGNVELENAINLYTEGIKLQEHCKNKLENAKLKIEKIVKDKEGINTESVNINDEN
ncbi:MAG: exodeoxyribonuclease VII small subunit [Candidatus Midichloriaceae bacterium]